MPVSSCYFWKSTVFLLSGAALLLTTTQRSWKREWASLNHPKLDRIVSIKRYRSSAEHHKIQFPRDQPSSVFFYKMCESGLGSQLMNFFLKVIFFELVHNRTPVVIESTYKYRRDAAHGVLTGFFSPRFPVIDEVSQHWMVEELILHDDPEEEHVNLQNWTTTPLRHFPATPPPVFLVGNLEYRAHMINSVKGNASDEDELYERILRRMCPDMEFNTRTLQEIQQLLEENRVPNDFFSTTSVGFHVRRGDKVTSKESKLFSGDKYLDKLKRAVPISPEPIRYCFVATDDGNAVREIAKAAQHHDIGCKVLSLNASLSASSTLTFLTELYVLSRTTSFVGSFNSNVGGLVALLRGCQNPNSHEHYAQSFGVDSEQWYIL